MSDSNFVRAPDANDQFSRMQAVIDSHMAGKATATLAKVVSVHGGGVGPVGTVDVQPLVNQVDNAGTPTPHGVLYGLPYLRYQGGSSAVIVDPIAGDIGCVVFASRDISTVVDTKGQANPGSMRQMSMSDGMFMPGMLNAAPTTYLQLGGGQANLTAPVQVLVTTPEMIVTGNLTVANGFTGTVSSTDGSIVTFIGGVAYNANNSG